MCWLIRRDIEMRELELGYYSPESVWITFKVYQNTPEDTLHCYALCSYLNGGGNGE